VAQPVVTRRLDVFRGSDPLLETHGSKTTLTDKGKNVIPFVRRMLQEYDDLTSYLKNKRAVPDVVRVGTGSSASQFFLARAIPMFHHEQPTWEVETRVTRGEERIAGVVNGRFDLAIVSHDRLQIEDTARNVGSDGSLLTVTELAQLRICVLARKGTPEGEQIKLALTSQPLPSSMLCRLKLVGLDRQSGVRRQIEQKFSASSTRPRFSGDAGGWLAIKEYARQGLGAGIFPAALLSQEDISEFVVRTLSNDIAIRYVIVCRGDQETDGSRALLEALQKAAQLHQEELRRRWSRLMDL
jgi:DNA-binding transcriptional LysR family regulator